MKNKIIIACSLAALLLTACEPYTENLFDKPAEVRIAESLQTYRELLTAQTKGWLVEYFPEKTQRYGGFNLFFRFENEKVTVRSEIDPAASATSSWSMGTDMGPTLNFNSYNEVLHHYFCDPAVPLGGGYGLNREGDYEFVVMSGSETEFILMGKKTKNTIRMTPVPSNSSWDEYGNSIVDMRSNIIAPAYRMTLNNKEISIEKKVNANLFIFKTGGEIINAPFIVTLKGIKFYEPVKLLNVELSSFTWRPAEDNLVSNDGSAVISFIYTSLSNYFVNNLPTTDWFLKTDNIGPGLLPAWNAAKNALDKEDGERLFYMWFGSLGDEYPVGLSFACWDYENNTAWAGTYVYNFQIISNNQIKFVFNLASTNANGINANYYASRLQYFTIAPFNGKTFTLEPDVDISNPKNMTNIKNLKLIDTADSNNWLTIGLEEVRWP